MEEWKKIKIGEFLTQKKRSIIIDSETKYSLVTISNRGEVKQREIKSGATISAQKGFIAKEGDFIYSRLSVHTGAFGIVPPELNNALITNEMPCFEIDKTIISPDILIKMFGLSNFFWQLNQLTKGMGRVRIKESMMLSLSLVLPDITEQKQIVKYFERIETEDRELKQELTHQQSLLKKLRQQILQEAIEGKLSQDWRAENPNAEPAGKLLKRIQAEKQQLIKDKKSKNQKPLPAISEAEKPFELPERWAWLKIDYFLEYKNRGMITGPFGTALQKIDHQFKGIPVYGIETIKNGRFTYKNKIFVTLEKADELSSFSANSGDIIISRSGTIDEICVIPDDTEPALISTNLLRVSLVDELVDSTYFCYLFKGGITVLAKLKELCGGSTRLFLNQKILKALVFPLPPLAEQKAIVAKVEKLLSLCDQLQAQITQNQSHADGLMQAVLTAAFSQGNDKAE